MGQKIKLDDKEYEVETLSDTAKAMIDTLQFSTKRIKDLENMQVLLQRAKNSYLDSLKHEMLSQKAGLLFGEDK
jgi:hypothetical protein